jgi:hypothetical protein
MLIEMEERERLMWKGGTELRLIRATSEQWDYLHSKVFGKKNQETFFF